MPADGQYYEKNDDWGSRAQLGWNGPGDTVVNLSWENERLNQPARPAIGLVDVAGGSRIAVDHPGYQ
jgi:iron complex outermembrane receptor protein